MKHQTIARGVAMYGRFPHQWIDPATEIAKSRTGSNSGRKSHKDRGASRNPSSDIVGVLAERIAVLYRPDIGARSPKVLAASGSAAPKSDSVSGVDIKSAPYGRPRFLVNCNQAHSGIIGVLAVLVDVEGSWFWMSPVIPIQEVQFWEVFEGPYGDPAYSISQSDLTQISRARVRQ